MKSLLLVIFAGALVATAQAEHNRAREGGRRPMPVACPVDHTKALDTQINNLVKKVIQSSGSTSPRKKAQLDQIVSDLDACQRLQPAYYADCVIKYSNEAVALAMRAEPTRPTPGHPYAKTCTVRLNSTNTFGYMNDSNDFSSSKVRLINNGAVLAFVGYGPVYYEGSPREGVQLRVVSNPRTSDSNCAQSGEIVWFYKNTLSHFNCNF